MHRFTSEFGMGSGGSNALLPPGKLFGKQGLAPFSLDGSIDKAHSRQLRHDNAQIQRPWALYGQAARAISTG